MIERWFTVILSEVFVLMIVGNGVRGKDDDGSADGIYYIDRMIQCK